MRRSYSFVITGLGPSADPEWRYASPSARAAYFRIIKELVLIAFDAQLAAGLDKDGDPFFPLRPGTIKYRRSAMGPADPHAPALQPAHGLSRTRSLVDARVEGSWVRVFWRHDPLTGSTWGKTLDYHRRGAGPLPIRDVFGLSPESLASVRREGLTWWRAFAAGLPVRSPLRPVPGRAAKPVVAGVPEYKPKDRVLHGTRKSTTHQVAIGGNVYTMSSGTTAEVMAAIKAGTFSGFKSYN